MRSTVVIIAMIAVASCSPQRRLARLIEKHPEIMPKDTVVEHNTVLLYRDTVVIREIPGDTVVKEVELRVPAEIPDASLTLETSLAEATASIYNNILGLKLVQRDSIFHFKLDSAIQENIDTVRIETTIQVPVELKPKPFYKNGFWILLGLILAGLVVFAFFVTRKR